MNEQDEQFAQELLDFSAELDRKRNAYTLRAEGDYWIIRRADKSPVFYCAPKDEAHARKILHNLNRAPEEPKLN